MIEHIGAIAIKLGYLFIIGNTSAIAIKLGYLFVIGNTSAIAIFGDYNTVFIVTIVTP